MVLVSITVSDMNEYVYRCEKCGHVLTVKVDRIGKRKSPIDPYGEPYIMPLRKVY